MMRSSVRSTHNPTGDSGPTPSFRSRCASWFERASTSRYVRRRAPLMTAIASGVRATCASKSWGSVVSPGNGACVWFHSTSTRCRSSTDRTPTSHTRPASLATRPSTACFHCPSSRSTPAAEYRGVSNDSFSASSRPGSASAVRG
ncbi:hypothetical protein COSO111634_33425 [Corallococcus soli]